MRKEHRHIFMDDGDSSDEGQPTGITKVIEYIRSMTCGSRLRERAMLLFAYPKFFSLWISDIHR